MFYGSSGAFRCLTEGIFNLPFEIFFLIEIFEGYGGHVAFVMHTAVISNTDGRNVDQWARPLRTIDFELLCKNGTRKTVEAYKSCHMLKIPARVLMTSS
jgi:hypothetical protein